MTKFQYRERTAEQVKSRAEQGSRDFAVMVKRKHKVFSPKEGDYDVRFLPPTWDDADHYGKNVFVHYGVGADDESYLCHEKMNKNPCPICEEVARARKKNEDEKYIKDISPKKRVATWVIDRANEDLGPLVWFMPWTLDKDIAKVSYDHKTEEILAVDHPDEGYDVQFSREGAGLKTRYSGAQVDRRPSTLHKNSNTLEDWLDYVVENPITEALNFYDYDHILNVFNGGGSAEGRGEEETPPPAEEKSAGRSRRRDGPLPTAEEIGDMSEDRLWALVEEHSVEVDLDEFRSLRAKRRALTEALLGSEEEQEAAKEEEEEEKPSTASRLRQRLAARQQAAG